MADGTCSEDGCDGGVYARGVCQRHYEQKRANGTLLMRGRETPTPCAVEGCSGTVLSRGWCRSHYVRWQKHGDPLGGRFRQSRATQSPQSRAPKATQCAIPGCERGGKIVRSWCGLHYSRWLEHGDPLREPPPAPPAEQRFWAKVDKNGPVPECRPDLGQCWIWTGARVPRGYGHFVPDGRLMNAHRYSYKLNVGAVADEMVVDHLCRNPPCVRPEHLEAVTPRMNALRGIGPSAANARKTHCPAGHEYDLLNTIYGSRGARFCQKCRDELNRKRRTGRPTGRRRRAEEAPPG